MPVHDRKTLATHMGMTEIKKTLQNVELNLKIMRALLLICVCIALAHTIVFADEATTKDAASNDEHKDDAKAQMEAKEAWVAELMKIDVSSH